MNVIVTIESKPWRVCILAIERILSTPSIGNFETEKGKKEENKEKWRIDRGWRRKRKREAGKNENCTDTSVSGIFCFSCHRWRLKGHHRKFHTRADYRYHIPLNFLSFYFTANLHRPLYRASLRYCSLTKANGITDESVNWTLFFFFFFFYFYFFFFSLLNHFRWSVYSRVRVSASTRYNVTLYLDRKTRKNENTLFRVPVILPVVNERNLALRYKIYVHVHAQILNVWKLHLKNLKKVGNVEWRAWNWRTSEKNSNRNWINERVMIKLYRGQVAKLFPRRGSKGRKTICKVKQNVRVLVCSYPGWRANSKTEYVGEKVGEVEKAGTFCWWKCQEHNISAFPALKNSDCSYVDVRLHLRARIIKLEEYR